ncbi:ABSCISIC ACID-INSENSITIVE 5-like protein 2 isoform X2 [Lolium perenne]|uniref:ABSCISIC ACID-INSENSITIVE 5-like protein 2 isoform X2 n=1 Tax=Lolium perenne TaxID=4522 RepID=UPI0021F65264|nr:ABSCISIC ACID-INSENSITIVE 5-like protein 2 isoform X2 [Lolium perenne]
MIQAMASHSQSQAGGGGYAGPSGRQPQGLARQGSLYSLTLDEVQNQLTEPLLSMNLDELLKSVFPDGVDPDGAVAGQSEPPSGLHRQGSITMPPELSKKTVDEVWKGILDSPKKKSGEEGGWRRRERQLTLGEMTLEDFLLKAGVVTEGCLKDSSSDFPPNMDAAGSSVIAAGAPSLSSTAQAQWLQQYQQQALEPPHPSMPDPQTPGRKRGASSGGVPDKVVERRQKRMIKNRESAARSRARKQAYTNELENKVSHLEEENERLKRQKELDMLMISAPPPEPKYWLRRTSSSPV